MPRPTNIDLAEKSQLAEQGKKRCRKCREVFSLDAFGTLSRSQDGKQPWCKPCTNTRHGEYDRESYRKDPAKYLARKKAENARFRAANPEKNRENLRKYNLRKYGLTPETFEALLQTQKGLCAICFRTLVRGRGLHVDHDHATGAVRGLLCNGCNVGLGAFRDSPEALLSAVRYLQEG